MTLKQKIEEYKEGFKKKAPQEAQETMLRATNDLQNSPQMINTIKVGDMAPDFSLKNTANDDIAGITENVDGDSLLFGDGCVVFGKLRRDQDQCATSLGKPIGKNG
jgi:hypothetical protein